MPYLRDRKIGVVFTGAILFVFMFCCNAFAGDPSNIRVTNVRGTQFTVSWITTNEETGKVRYGRNIESHESWSTANDDRGTATADDIHHVTITNLIPNTLYFYEIISGATVDNNGGNYYSLNPGPALIPSGSCQPAGRVFKDQAKTQPAYDSIVYVTILGASEGQDSATESMVVTTETSGYWYLDLVNLRTKDYNAFYYFTCGTTLLRVEAQGGNDGTCELTTQGIDYQTAERPPIVLAKNTNDAPVITSTPVTTVDEDDTYSYTFTASDVDAGDELILSAPTLPDWLSFTPETGVLSGIPTNDEVGDHAAILRVNDGTVDVDQSFTITVTNTNDAPTISGVPATSVDEDTAYSFTPTADDIDVGDSLTFSIENKPAWASFDTVTGSLTGIPDNDNVGIYPGIVITVTDGKLTALLPSFDLIVLNLVILGDIDNGGTIDLRDAILTLKVVCGSIISEHIAVSADVNGDNRIGMADVIYILQRISDLK